MADKPKRTITPEQRAKMAAGRKAAAERRKKEREEEKARKKKELAEEKKRMKEAEKQQKDRLKNAEKDNAAKKRIKKELEQLKESMKIETKQPIPKEVLEKVVEEVAEEVEPVVEEKPKEIIEEKIEEKPLQEKKPEITKQQLKNLFDAKVLELLENINDENARDIFLDTANNYDFNESVDSNINRLMSRAKSRFQKNKEVIEIKKIEIEEKAKNDEYERVQLEKKQRLAKMRERYKKLRGV